MIPPIFRSTILCVTATFWVHYTTSCNTKSSAPEDGWDHRPKHVELIGINNKPLLLHLVGYLYYKCHSLSLKLQWSSGYCWISFKLQKDLLYLYCTNRLREIKQNNTELYFKCHNFFTEFSKWHFLEYRMTYEIPISHIPVFLSFTT